MNQREMKAMKNIFYLLLIFVNLFIAGSANANIEPYSSNILTGTHMVAGTTTLDGIDPTGMMRLMMPALYNDPATFGPGNGYHSSYNGYTLTLCSAFEDKVTNDQIIFQINGEHNAFVKQYIQAVVTFDADFYTYNGSYLGTSTHKSDIVLTIDYNPDAGTKYTDKAVFPYSGAYYVRLSNIRYQTFDNTGHPLSDPNFDLKADLQIKIESERYYVPYSLWDPAIGTGDINVSATATDMTISWPDKCAEWYDLEWTYIDDYGNANSVSGSAVVNNDFVFDGNATRINTSDLSYTIPLAFERGFVAFRVRPVWKSSVDGFNQPVAGAWSDASFGSSPYNTSTFPNKYHIGTAYQPLKLWQYTATYAEDGKRKDIMNYLDGSLRKRQVLTNINTDQISLVAETKYDYMGRGAVNILPAPKPSFDLNYADGFNFNTNSPETKYDKDDFDVDCGDICNPITKPLENSLHNGAGNYYSHNNPDRADFNAYLPESAYPFTQTEYTPDNTGRIRRQSGAGEYHMLGSGHETRYYYEKPSPEELYKLFGADVGYADHYKKNIVVDPNGQVSVSYLDMAGKVIATALAGEMPDNLQQLPSYDGAVQTITATIIDKDVEQSISLSEPDPTLSYSQTYVPTTPGHFDISYTMSGGTYLPCTSNCDDCVYDVDVIVAGECGNIKYEEHQTSVGGQELNGTCDAPANLSTSFSADLDKVEEYTISKTVHVNKSALDFYTDQFMNSACLKTLDDFVDEQLANMDTTDCYVNCTACNGGSSADPDDSHLPPFAPTAPDLDGTKEDCMDDCSGSSWCEAGLESMLNDMSPYGQYGALSPDSPNALMSVYTLGNLLPQRNLATLNAGYYPVLLTDYQHPMLIRPTGTVDFKYYEEDLHTISHVEIGGVIYTPDQLTVEQFVQNWKPSWAYSLIAFHPEYEYYEWCVTNTMRCAGSYTGLTSEEFDRKLLTINTFAAAKADPDLRNFFSASGGYNSWSTSINVASFDPFFNQSNPFYQGLAQNPLGGANTLPGVAHLIGAGFGTLDPAVVMNAAIYNYQKYTCGYSSTVSMMQIAHSMTDCPITGDCMASYVGPSMNIASQSNPDQEWINFRSLYIAFKQHLQQIAAHEYAMAKESYNGCIGNEDFNPYDYGFMANATLGFQVRDIFSCPPSLLPVPTPPAFAAKPMQYLENFHQPCWMPRAGLLVNMIKRFGMPQDYMKNSTNPYVDPCGSQRGLYETAAAHYTSACGPCPDAVLLEQFINGSIQHPYFASTPHSYDITDFINWTPALQRVFFNAGPRPTSISTTSSVDGTNTFSFIFNQADCQNCRIDIHFPDTVSSSLTVANILSVCCISNYTGTPVVSSDPDHDFLLHAQVKGRNWNNTADSVYEILLIGYISCIPYPACQYTNEVCVTFDEAYKLQSFFNGLAVGFDGTFNPILSLTPKFLPGSPANSPLFTPNYTGFKNLIKAKNHLSATDQVFWHSDGVSISGPSHLLKGSIRKDDVTILCNITLDITALLNAGKGLTDIIAFDSITVDPTGVPSNTASQKFTINVLVNGGPSDPYNPIKIQLGGSTTCFNIGICGQDGIDFSQANISQDDMEAMASANCAGFLNNTGPNLIIDGNFESGAAAPYGLVPADYVSACPVTFNQHLRKIDASDCVFSPTSSHQFTGFDHTYAGTPVTLYTPPATPPLGYSQPYGHFLFSSDIQGTGHDLLFRQATTPVVSGKYYSFTTWFMYAEQALTSNSSPGDIQVYINGQQVYSHSIYNTPGTWNKINLIWRANSTNADISIKYTGSSALGLDDINMFAYECQQSALCDPDTMMIEYQNDCVQAMIDLATSNGEDNYNNYLDSVREAFREQYIAHCLSSVTEGMTMKYTDREHHYTLYFYDQASNLLRTVPPRGVVDDDNGYVNFLSDVTEPANYHSGAASYNPGDIDPYAGSNDPASQCPNYNFVTNYEYNSKNQVTYQSTPDGGATFFYYDYLDRLVISQNQKQREDGLAQDAYIYSYTLYDRLGRIVEVGQVTNPSSPYSDFLGRTLSSPVVNNNYSYTGLFELWINSGVKTQITRTFYDNSINFTVPTYFSDGLQSNLRTRVATAAYYETDVPNYSHATHYTYDIHGNVKELIQENPDANLIGGESIKMIAYEYDLISGKVNHVKYQDNKWDQFHHLYQYDADNRIVEVQTTDDKQIYDRDAAYQYYKHGPLARLEIGEQKVQGMDYAYTIQGWLKGINSNTISDKKMVHSLWSHFGGKLLNGQRDMGKDGYAGNIAQFHNTHSKFALDAFSYSLGYFDDDYNAIGLGAGMFNQASIPDYWLSSTSGTDLMADRFDLWNGNISHMAVAFIQPDQSLVTPRGYAFTYDQLNRLMGSKYHDRSVNSFKAYMDNSWNDHTSTDDYATSYAYDPNGNINSLQRNATSKMDRMEYTYDPSPTSFYDYNNKLDHVNDGVDHCAYDVDIDDQKDGNYHYDGNGNLIFDESEHIVNIDWNVYGKISQIQKDPEEKVYDDGCGGDAPKVYDIAFKYDAAGNRVEKILKPHTSVGVNTDPGSWLSTFYVRDASGNIMATYDLSADEASTCCALQNVAIFDDGTAIVDLGTGPSSELIHTYASLCQCSYTIYKLNVCTYKFTTRLGEHDIYGSSRLGIRKGNESDVISRDISIAYWDEESAKKASAKSGARIASDPAAWDKAIKALQQQLEAGIIPSQYQDQAARFIKGNADQSRRTAARSSSPIVPGSYIILNPDLSGNVVPCDGHGSRQSSKVAATVEPEPKDTGAGNTLLGTFDGPMALPGGQAKANTNTDLEKMMHTLPGYDQIPAGEGTGASAARVGTTTSHSGSETMYYRTLGFKHYELTDHLGNVGVTITDRKVAYDDFMFDMHGGAWYVDNTSTSPTYMEYDHTHSSGNANLVLGHADGITDYYLADISSATDYYPFGMQMPDRNFTTENYRFGFNGKEKDDEVKPEGKGNSLGFEAREFDARLAKWISYDPKEKQYPWQSTYAYFANCPITIWDEKGKGQPAGVTQTHYNDEGGGRPLVNEPTYMKKFAGFDLSDIKTVSTAKSGGNVLLTFTQKSNNLLLGHTWVQTKDGKSFLTTKGRVSDVSLADLEFLSRDDNFISGSAYNYHLDGNPQKDKSKRQNTLEFVQLGITSRMAFVYPKIDKVTNGDIKMQYGSWATAINKQAENQAMDKMGGSSYSVVFQRIFDSLRFERAKDFHLTNDEATKYDMEQRLPDPPGAFDMR